MSEPLAERREQILGELAEWMHAAARDAQRRLLDAEDTDEFTKLTASLCKLARGVRQSILVQRKLEGERQAAEAKAEREAQPSEFVPRHIKRVRLRTAVYRHIWNEIDDDETELVHEDLNARLDELQADDDFLDIPTDDLIAKLCKDLGFDPPPSPLIPAKAGTQAERAGSDVSSEAQGPSPATHSANTS